MDKCLEVKSSSPRLETTSLIAAVEGGRDPVARKFSASEVTKRPVQGFLLDGFHEGGAKAENLSWPEIKELFQDTIEILPKVSCSLRCKAYL